MVLEKVFNSLWHNLFAIGQVFNAENGQILKAQFGHLVTLIGILFFNLGSGCAPVGREVASDSRSLRFESCLWQKFILNIYSQLYWKDENKEKEKGNRPFLNKCFNEDFWVSGACHSQCFVLFLFYKQSKLQELRCFFKFCKIYITVNEIV